jgi:ABC-type antimicrobial peptide transport system permease subunit
MAPGASRARVVGGVATQPGGLVAGGLVAGTMAAWWLSTLAGRFLFGIEPRDPRAYAVAVLTLGVAAVAAPVLPARRAASIDPTEALREQ